MQMYWFPSCWETLSLVYVILTHWIWLITTHMKYSWDNILICKKRIIGEEDLPSVMNNDNNEWFVPTDLTMKSRFRKRLKLRNIFGEIFCSCLWIRSTSPLRKRQSDLIVLYLIGKNDSSEFVHVVEMFLLEEYAYF